MKRFLTFISVLLICAAPAMGEAAKYEIDVDHSSVTFKIRHLIGKVRGSFDKFQGIFEYEKGKPDQWKTEGSVDVASINTNVAERDKHLRSKDFFDVKNTKNPEYATMTFKSSKITNAKKDKAKMHGELFIHGVTKKVVFDLEIGGAATDPWGNQKAAFTAVTTVNRKDFGLNWNEVLETGGLLVGEDVEITLEIEGNLKK